MRRNVTKYRELKTYGKKQTGCTHSECCYIGKGYGYSILQSEVEELRNAVSNRPEDFIPEYLPRIKNILGDGKFIKHDRFDKNVIRLVGDRSRSPIGGIYVYYPCHFLEVYEDFGNESSACMIHPQKFQVCKEKSCGDCYRYDE